jgi:hypothetical protein
MNHFRVDYGGIEPDLRPLVLQAKPRNTPRRWSHEPPETKRQIGQRGRCTS